MELRDNSLVEKHTKSKRRVDFDASEPEEERVKVTTSALGKIKASGKKAAAENVHKEHRQRLKSQYLNHGLSSLSDVQKLELLLFYAIPQKDTNPTAHELLKEMGSIKNVLTSDISRLVKVKGIKENSAILISLVGNLFNHISMPDTREYIGSTTLAKEFCTKLYAGVEVEQFYVICLSRSNRVTKYKLIKAGTIDEIDIQIRSITEFAIEQKCNRIIVSHNHPAGLGMMSDEDCKFTYSLLCSCMLNSIEVVDHIIVGTDRAISMSGQHMLDRLKRKAFESLRLQDETKLFPSSVADEYIVDD